MNVARVLLDCGANTELCTNSGETALLKVSTLLKYNNTSCKYLSSGWSKLSREHVRILSALAGLCPAEVRSFISIHQVAPATVLLLLCACFIVIRQVLQALILLYRMHR